MVRSRFIFSSYYIYIYIYIERLYTAQGRLYIAVPEFSSQSPLTDAGPTDAPSLGRYAVSTAVHERAAYQVRWRPQCCPPPDQITLIHHPGHPADSLIIISESTQTNIYIYRKRVCGHSVSGHSVRINHGTRIKHGLYVGREICRLSPALVQMDIKQGGHNSCTRTVVPSCTHHQRLWVVDRQLVATVSNSLCASQRRNLRSVVLRIIARGTVAISFHNIEFTPGMNVS